MKLKGIIYDRNCHQQKKIQRIQLMSQYIQKTILLIKDFISKLIVYQMQKSSMDSKQNVDLILGFPIMN